jgi:hypothetical protein
MSASLLRNAILASLGVLAACGGETADGPTGSAGASGTGGSTAGTGGSTAGTGGATAGTGGSGGATAGTGGTGGSTAGSAGSSATFACATPTPSEQYPGIEVCDRGGLRRTEPVTCANGLPRPADVVCTAGNPGAPNECTKDADCSAKPYGTCGGGFDGSCRCTYGCLQDDDCGPGFACLCGSPVGQCVAATCRTNGDCPSGACRLDLGNGCNSASLSCASPADMCQGPADCSAGGLSACTSDGAVFACGGGCVIGRPLLVAGTLLVASLRTTDAWT